MYTIDNFTWLVIGLVVLFFIPNSSRGRGTYLSADTIVPEVISGNKGWVAIGAVLVYLYFEHYKGNNIQGRTEEDRYYSY